MIHMFNEFGDAEAFHSVFFFFYFTLSLISKILAFLIYSLTTVVEFSSAFVYVAI